MTSKTNTPASQPEPLLYSRRQAARMLGICQATCDTLIHLGILRHVRVGSRVMVPRAALETFATQGYAKRIRPE